MGALGSVFGGGVVSIEAIARRFVAARREARRLKALCASFVCDREAKGEYSPDAHTPRPCWKASYVAPEPETGAGGWDTEIDPDEWCDPCKAREVARLQLRHARRSAAGLLSALTGAVGRAS